MIEYFEEKKLEYIKKKGGAKMENTLAVEKAVFFMYKDMFNEQIDEMKMHKLMYFTQREALIQRDEQLFSEEFHGWKYGPVLNSVRSEFQLGTLFRNVKEEVSEATKELIRNVLERFGSISSWNLSLLSHQELSWKMSRLGLSASDRGDLPLSISAIRLDAMNEKAKRESLNIK